MAGAKEETPPAGLGSGQAAVEKKAAHEAKEAKEQTVKEASNALTGRPEEDEDEEDDEIVPEAQPSFPRNEVDKANSKVRKDAVHVYGLDFLQTGHMDEIFSQFKHRWIEWINDSSANIVFGDAASAKKALESLSFAKTGDDPWRRTPDILVSEDVPPIFLQMRYATPTDVKPSRKAVPKAAPPHQPSRPVQGKTKARPRVPNEPVTGGNLLRLGYPPGLDQELEPAGQRGQGGTGGTGDVGRMAQKRQVVTQSFAFALGIPANEEELAKRQRRAQRFGETVSKPQAASARSSASPTSEETARRKEEETAKRIKRDARFGSTDSASALRGHASKSASVMEPYARAEVEAA